LTFPGPRLERPSRQKGCCYNPPVRRRHFITTCGWAVLASAMFLLPASGVASAQVVEITPETSITPSSHITSWIFQMAVASVILSVLVLIGFVLAYLRFAPKFSGREEKARPATPGSRPPALARQAAALKWTPPPATAGGHADAAAAPAGRATATAVAERPAAPAAPAESSATPAAQPAAAEASTEGAAAAADASVTATAGPSGEPAVQADAVGEAEAAAPEPRPSAKTAEEVAAPPAESTPSAAPASSPAPAGAPAPTPAPAAASHGGAQDQETFDRVLQEQLAKGVDRRVAEGRARAAAVVAARKKGQG
jgi:hypothetical protein